MHLFSSSAYADDASSAFNRRSGSLRTVSDVIRASSVNGSEGGVHEAFPNPQVSPLVQASLAEIDAAKALAWLGAK
jgi:hypothetical protein